MYKAGDICRLGGYTERTLRHVLRQQLVPDLTAARGSGHHRVFTPKQAFLLALACELRQEGLQGRTCKAVMQVAEGYLRETELVVSSGRVVTLRVDVAALRHKLRIKL